MSFPRELKIKIQEIYKLSEEQVSLRKYLPNRHLFSRAPNFRIDESALCDLSDLIWVQRHQNCAKYALYFRVSFYIVKISTRENKWRAFEWTLDLGNSSIGSKCRASSAYVLVTAVGGCGRERLKHEINLVSLMLLIAHNVIFKYRKPKAGWSFRKNLTSASPENERCPPQSVWHLVGAQADNRDCLRPGNVTIRYLISYN